MKKLFEQNHERFDGIRPINIYGMRFIYFLMATFLAMDVWTHIITYDQRWDSSDAMNWSVWGAFTIFAVVWCEGWILRSRFNPIPTGGGSK